MEIQPVSQKNNKALSALNTVTTAAAAGAIASEIHRFTMPAEVKAALSNTSRGVDAFVNKSIKAANKTMKNLSENRATNPGFKIVNGPNNAINIEKVAENAREIYPKMLETAKTAAKKLNKTFAVVAGAALIGMVVSNLIGKGKAAKAEKEQ